MQEDRIEADPPTGDQPATPGGSDRLIAAPAAVIHDAMAADDAAGRDLPLSGEEDED